MVRAWMGKGRWMPRSASAVASSWATPSSSNVGCVMSKAQRYRDRPLVPKLGSARQDPLDRLGDLGRLGIDLRREAGDDLAARRDQELLEVPADVSAVALAVGVLGELLRRAGAGRRR